MKIPAQYAPIMELSLLNLVEKGYRIISPSGVDTTSEILGRKSEIEMRFHLFVFQQQVRGNG